MPKISAFKPYYWEENMNKSATQKIYAQYYQCFYCGAYFTQKHECWEDQHLIDDITKRN